MPNIIHKIATIESLDRNSIIFTYIYIYIYHSPTGILSNQEFTQYSCYKSEQYLLFSLICVISKVRHCNADLRTDVGALLLDCFITRNATWYN